MNQLVTNPFGTLDPKAQQESAGSRQLQSRENSEVMALVLAAKRFPRNQLVASDKIRNAFTRVTLAEKSQYQFARGGTDISGPSIRAAEAISQQWGNMSNGWREVSRFYGPDGIGVSEVEAYSVDYESGSRESIQFVVRHWRDTKKGGYALKDERDIYELCANQAQRRKRACILAQIPGDITEMAMEQAEVTLKTSADTGEEAMGKMLVAFAPFGVTKAMIEKRIQRRLDAIQPAQVVSLKRIYASLRDEMSEPGEWFELEPTADGTGGATTGSAGLKAAVTKPPKTAKEKADPTTGEMPPDDKATTAESKASQVTEKKPDAGKPKTKSYAMYVDEINNATGAEPAALALDLARNDLPDDQLADLAGVWSRKWQPKP